MNNDLNSMNIICPTISKKIPSYVLKKIQDAGAFIFKIDNNFTISNIIFKDNAYTQYAIWAESQNIDIRISAVCS